MKLKTVRAKQCRGIVDGPDLPLGSGGLLLCGSNGTGKSSYIDALEFALTGQCSSLDTGDRGLSWGSHGAHVNSTSAPEVEIVFDMGGSEYTWARAAAVTPPAQVKAFIDAAQDETFILRRKAILDFIDAKPAERYKALEGFFRLDDYANFEAKLKALATEAQQRLRAAQEEQRGDEAALRLAAGASTTAPVDASACLELANTVSVSSSFAPLADLNDLPARIQEVQAALRHFQNMDMVQKLRGLSELITSLSTVSVSLEAGRTYLERVVACADEEAKLKGQFLEDVLKHGLKWMEMDRLDCCALCEQPVDLEKLAIRIQERLAANEGLTKLRLQREQQGGQFGRLLKGAAAEWTKLAQQWRATLGEEPPEYMTARQTALTGLATGLTTGAEQVSATLTTLEGLDLDALKSVLAKQVHERAQAYPDYAAYQGLVRAQNVLTAISVFMQRSALRLKAIAHYETSLSAAKKLASHAEVSRKAAVQRTVEAITGKADEYFREIHPEESIGKPVLTVPRQGAGSLQLKSDFYGKESDPRGYYSEGHVDSLGLCLFLALRRLHHNRRPEFSLLVLDDVLHSVDGEHRRTTADLIFREFADHQIVITTHDMLWFEQLKRASQEHVKGRKFEARRIGTWSLTEGPVWGDHLSDREWLASPQADLARPADRVIKVGRMLEHMLQYLCDHLSVPVPFEMTGRYTLDPLWTAFTSKANEYKEFNTASQAVISVLKAHISARNAVGGHHNEWAQGFTPDEAKALSDAALNLHKLTYCGECKAFIKRIPQLDGVWSCKGEHLKYRKKPPAAAKV